MYLFNTVLSLVIYLLQHHYQECREVLQAEGMSRLTDLMSVVEGF